jgi:hypothetical protein
MLWLIDPHEPEKPYPADPIVNLIATAVAAGLMDPPELPVCPVIDLSAVRIEGSTYD